MDGIVMPLTLGYSVVVDMDDYKYLMQWKWSAHKANGLVYAARSVSWNINNTRKHRIVLMHRELIGITGMQVDHKNHDTLDNRRDNLRIVTRRQNSANSRSSSATGYKGVVPHGAKFRSQITFNRKTINLGHYPTKQEAARAYDAKALELFGECASINFPTQEHLLAGVSRCR